MSDWTEARAHASAKARTRLVVVMAAVGLCGCAGEHPDGSERLASEPAPLLRRAPADLPHLAHSATVLCDPEHPAPATVPASLREALSLSGCRIVDDLACDLVVICRAREGPPVGAAQGRGDGRHEFIRATSLWPPETLVRVPPDWRPRVPQPNWRAVVEILVEDGAVAAQKHAGLHEINIRAGVKGLSDPSFDHSDIDDLWKVLDWWADEYASGS